MTPDELRELARHHIEDVWARGDRAALRRIYSPDVVDHAPAPGQAPGIAGLDSVMDAFTTAFPDLSMTLLGAYAEDGHAVDHWRLRATHTGDFLGVPATGRRVEFDGMDVLRVQDGRITEVWHTEDLATALRQVTAGEQRDPAPSAPPVRPEIGAP